MNIYACLDESDNEEDQTKKVVPPKKAATTGKSAPVKKDAAKPATKGKGENTAPGNANKSKDSKAPVAVDPDADAGKDNNRGGRPRGKEGHHRGEHKHEGGDAGARRPKREFERRSGTGRGREVSRGGRGSFGAGNAAQDALEAEKDPKSAEAPIESAAEDADAAVEAEPEAEPEPVTFTLDEYMQIRNEARAKAAALVGETKERKVNKDSAEFAGLKTVEGEEVQDYLPGVNSKGEAIRKDQRSTVKTPVVNVGFKFEANQQSDGYRGGGDRGSRGGDRPFRGGGGGRGGRSDGRGGGRGDGGRGRGDNRRGGGGGGRSGPTTVFNNMDFPAL